MKQTEEKAPNSSGGKILEMNDIKRASSSRRIKRQKLSEDYSAEVCNNSKNWPTGIGTVEPEIMDDMGVGRLNEGENAHKPPSKKLAQVLGRTNTSKHEIASAPTNSDDFFLCRRRLSNVGEDLSNKLSDELILMIFRWVPKKTLVQCALVCKRWRQIAYDESLWSRLDLSSRVLQSDSLTHVLQRGVTALRMAHTDVREPLFSPSCPFFEEGVFSKLQYLDLSMTVINRSDLAALLKTARSLLKLSVEHCFIIPDSCTAIGSNSDLEVLNMSMCYGLEEESIKSILMGCRKLLEFNLAWTNLSSSTLDIVAVEAPRTLKRLNVSGCRKCLSDDHVQQLVTSCPNLVELDLSDCTNLTSRCIEFICGLHKLEHIALSRCYNIGSSAYLLLSSMNSLLYLDVLGLFADQSLTHLQQNLANISVNKFLFSSIARPTVGVRRTSIWGLKVRR